MIATIAIVLLTITAVGILAGFVVPFVKESLYGSTECLDYKEYFTFYRDFDYNCYSLSGNYLYAVSIRADSAKDEAAEKVDGFTLQFIGEGESQPATVKIGSMKNEIRMLNASKTELEVPFSGEVKTYVYNSSVKYSSVEIYPLLKSGTVCDMSDSIKIGDEICNPPL